MRRHPTDGPADPQVLVLMDLVAVDPSPTAAPGPRPASATTVLAQELHAGRPSSRVWSCRRYRSPVYGGGRISLPNGSGSPDLTTGFFLFR